MKRETLTENFLNYRANSDEGRHQSISTHNSSRLTPTNTLEEEQGNHSFSDNSFDTGFEPAQYADIDATNENILASARAAEVVIETNSPMSVTGRLNTQEYTHTKDSSTDSAVYTAPEEQNVKSTSGNEKKLYDDISIGTSNNLPEERDLREQFVDEDEPSVHESPAHESPVHESPAHESHVHEPPVHESPVHESNVHESNVHESPATNENDEEVIIDQIQENEVTTEKEKPQRTINRRKKDSGPVSRNSSCVSTDSTTSTATVDSGIVMRLDSSPRDSPISSDQYLNSKDLSTSRETLDGDVNALDEINKSSSFYDNNHSMQNNSMLDSGTHEGASSTDIDDLDTEKVIIQFLLEKFDFCFCILLGFVVYGMFVFDQ